jgi:predicted DNA-binding protein (MmcQ/YjbR family)
MKHWNELPNHKALLDRLRKICLQWPESAEAIKWGHPTFVAGKKLFAAFGEHNDRLVVGFWLPPELWGKLVDDVTMIPAPYSARFGWVNVFLDKKVNWKTLEAHLLESYKHAALKRMIAKLDSK